MTERGFFKEDKCTRCGECFTRCQYMDLTRKEAILEIQRLIDGKPTRVVENKCISCYACDAFCPEDAHPYELILERWNKRYEQKGLPVRAAYVMPHHAPNYREDVIPSMSSREKELLSKWRETPSSGEFLYPGCNLLTVPYLFDMAALSELPVSGDWSLCCGEPLFRSGMFGEVEKVAKGIEAYYADKKVDKMVFVCPACLNMFRNVFPRQFGAKLDFECEYIATWLLRRMDEGKLKIDKPLNREITIHDSCHARVLGDEIMEQTRELYRRLGLKIIETRRHHEEGLCCGIAAGCNRQMPQDITLAAWRQLREGEKTGAAEMAVYCTGCYLMLNIARVGVRTRQKLVHSLEYLGEASGEPRERTVEPRSARILANVIVKALPKLLSPRRYKMGELEIGAGMKQNNK